MPHPPGDAVAVGVADGVGVDVAGEVGVCVAVATMGVGVRVEVDVGVGLAGRIGVLPKVHQSPTLTVAPAATLRCHCKPKPLSIELLRTVLAKPSPWKHPPDTGQDMLSPQ